MKLFPAISLILFTISCTQKESAKEPTAEAIPETFQEEKYDVSLKSSRSYDLVEQLYAELLEKNPEQKKLDEALNALPDSVRKSTDAYETYTSRSESFYASASGKMNTMADTILRNKIKSVIEKHKSAYEQNIADLTTLSNSIHQNNFSISDQKTVMKVMLTMRMMEQYQKNQKPDKKALLKQISEQQELLKRMEKAVQ